MSREQRRSAGLIVFVGICLFGSWSVAATNLALRVDASQHRLGTQLFSLSLHYLATMGWQPVVAAWIVRRFVDREPVDLALRPPRARFSVVAVVSAVAFASAAAALAFAATRFGLLAGTTMNGAAEHGASSSIRDLPEAVLFLFGAMAALLLVWLQAVAEEIGWRGYVLPTAMRRFGHVRGLLLHAVMWGAWYAPVVFFSAFGRLDGAESLVRCLTFAVTCVLVGVLLGWLRLASDSVAPAVTANLTLTLLAGLPYVVHGIDAGLRSAILRPIGWIVLLAAVLLLLTRFRYVVRLRAEPVVDDRALAISAVFLLFGGTRDRTLH